MKHLFVLILLCCSTLSFAQSEKTVVVFDIKEDIAPAATRIAKKALDHAESIQADLIILHLNTYGGYVTDADSIRTFLLNSSIPVYVFIDNNAASAGALISVACDKIYMRPGGSIGAATVVNQSGEKAPDKYQSYMRKQMRSTAESHGFDTIVNGNDTIYRYKRNPDIAEGMVDESIAVPGLDDSTKVITLTADEALEWGYCDAKVNSIEEILELNHISDYRIERVFRSKLDDLVSFFANPALRSIFILMIIGGIYFELQSPGIGFALAVAVAGAIAYFAPLYLEGLAANWEILLFVVGLILIGLEIFVIPGFGVAGISGIFLTISSLVLSMIKNVNFDFTLSGTGAISHALMVVFVALVGFVVILLVFGRSILNSGLFQRVVLSDTLAESKISLNVEETSLEDLLDQEGTAMGDLKPIGYVVINDKKLNAKTYGEFIEQGEKIKVTSIENQYLVVKKV